jgi:general secretion pathway protein H
LPAWSRLWRESFLRNHRSGDFYGVIKIDRFEKGPSANEAVASLAFVPGIGRGMKGKKGFTLIELMVVLIVLSLGMVLLYPSFGRMSQNVELKAAVKKIASILRYYRSEAVQKGLVIQVVFDGETREIRVRPVEADRNQGGGEKSDESATGNKERYLLPEGILVKDMKIPASRYPSDLPVIEFYPNGGSNGGSFVLERENSKAYRIQVNFLTGVVEIKES